MKCSEGPARSSTPRYRTPGSLAVALLRGLPELVGHVVGPAALLSALLAPLLTSLLLPAATFPATVPVDAGAAPAALVLVLVVVLVVVPALLPSSVGLRVLLVVAVAPAARIVGNLLHSILLIPASLFPRVLATRVPPASSIRQDGVRLAAALLLPP